jgi:hypothetical protein
MFGAKPAGDAPDARPPADPPKTDDTLATRSPMKIAAVQMVSTTERRANLDAARTLLARAAREGARLAILPEYFCIMGRSDRDKLAVAEAPARARSRRCSPRRRASTGSGSSAAPCRCEAARRAGR